MRRDMAIKFGKITAFCMIFNVVATLLAQVSSEGGWMSATGDSTSVRPTGVGSAGRIKFLSPIGRGTVKKNRAISSEMATLRALQARIDLTPEEAKRGRRKSKKALCLSLPGLVSRQRKMCVENPDLVVAAVDGTEIAVEECQRQFKYERWNCSLLISKATESSHRNRRTGNADESEGEILTPGLRNATREAAFVHAIMSAGITHAVTVACRRGELGGCHCDKSVSKLNLAMKIIREMIAWDETNSANGENEIAARATLEAIRTRRLYGAASTLLVNRTWSLSRTGESRIRLEEELEKISWGGCSDDVRFGVRFSRRFLEAPHKGVPQRRRMAKDDIKLHNGEVGRKVVQDLTKVHCRCHGMSGACTAQTCWMQMPNFQEIGDALKRKYVDGIRATGGKKRRRLRHITEILQFVTVNSYDIDSGRLRKVPKTQLAFINDTPNLCFENATLGISGTAGRQCLKHSDDKGDCRFLCCGRGYNTEQVKIRRRCKCKFVYCCDVQCEICDEVKNIYTCKS